jgi:hypothetical protein
MLVGNTPIHVFNELQISLFPSTKQTIEIQLTSDIASFINSYFFEQVDAPNTSNRTENDSKGSLFGSRVSGTREISHDSSDEEEDMNIASNKGGGSSGDTPTPIVYLKYCRIGEVTLELSTVGFGKKWGVNLDRENISLNSPAFHRSQRIVTWAQLGAKYCKHVGTSLVTGSRKKSILPLSSNSSYRANEDEDEDEEVTSSSKSIRLSSMGSVSVVQKSVLGVASSMLKAKATASSALKKTTSSKSSNSQKEARDMLFGGKR